MFYHIIAFFIGASAASAILCYTDCVKANISWLGHSRSKCQNCKHILRPQDLIPVISYVCLKGKCRDCGAKIPITIFVGELFMGFMTVWGFRQFLYNADSISLEKICYFLFLFILAGEAVMDIKWREVQLPISFALVTTSFILFVHRYSNSISFVSSVAWLKRFCVALIALFMLNKLACFIRLKRTGQKIDWAMGGADILAVAAGATILNISSAFLWIYISAIINILILISEKRLFKRSFLTNDINDAGEMISSDGIGFIPALAVSFIPSIQISNLYGGFYGTFF